MPRRIILTFLCCWLGMLHAASTADALLRVNEYGMVDVYEPGSKTPAATLKLNGLKSPNAQGKTIAGTITFQEKTSPASMTIVSSTPTEADFSWEAPALDPIPIRNNQLAIYLSTNGFMGTTCLFRTASGQTELVRLPEASEMARKWLFMVKTPMAEFTVPLQRGMLRATGLSGGAGVFIWDRGGAIRLFPANGKLEGKIHLNYIAYRSEAIPLAPAANRSFADPTADDGQGGWSDQGPEQDLSDFRISPLECEGIRFAPEISGKKQAIVVAAKGFRGAPDTVTLPMQGQKFRWLYLLHSFAWLPMAADTPCGTLEVSFQDGSQQKISLRGGKDGGNWFQAGKNSKNYFVAWRGKSQGGAPISLGASRFAVRYKPIQKLTFHAADNKTVWMIAAVTGTPERLIHFSPMIAEEDREIPLEIKEGKQWKRFTYEHGIQAGSAMDFSGLMPNVPAGTFGKPVVRGEHFEFANNPGKPVRFYGGNVVFLGNFLNDVSIAYYPQWLRQAGFNSVRLHHFDRFLVKPGEKLVFNEAYLDRFFRSIAEFKKAGLYVTLDLYTIRVNGFPAQYISKTGNALAFIKMMALFEPAVMDNMVEFARVILTRKNPYTGMTLAEDPALLSVALINEVPFLQPGNGAVWNSPHQVLRQPLNEAFRRWCEKRNLPFRPNPDSATWARFQLETCRDAINYYKHELAKMGVTAPISQLNNQKPFIISEARRANDYFDMHWYMSHPGEDINFQIKYPGYFRNVSSVEEFWRSPILPAGLRLTGMPSMITEYHFCAQSPFRGEGGAIGGAFSAMQNFDGIFEFDVVNTISNKPEEHFHPKFQRISSFEYTTDPISLISGNIFNCFYVRGDIRPAERSFYLELPEKIWENRHALGYLSMRPNELRNANLPEEFIRLGAVGKLAICFAGNRPALKPGDRIFTLDEILASRKQNSDPNRLLREIGGIDSSGWIHASNGQISLNSKQNLFRAVTPRSEALIQRGSANCGERLAVRRNTTFSTVFAGAVSEGTLASAKRILLLHITNVAPANRKWSKKGNQLLYYEDKGTEYPHLIHVGQAEISLKTDLPGKVRLYALDLTGKRQYEVPFHRNADGIVFTADTGAKETPMAYELVKE